MALNLSDKSRILRRYFPGMTRNREMSTEPSQHVYARIRAVQRGLTGVGAPRELVDSIAMAVSGPERGHRDAEY